MNRALLCVPYLYFWATRVRDGSLAFHVLFEWAAAAVLVALLYDGPMLHGLLDALASYIAFISLYEIGYIVNDLVIAPREAYGRKRGPQGTGASLLALWVSVRLLVFLLITWRLDMFADLQWLGFFTSLCLVFAAHNYLKDKELKAGTFLWLSWYRFMAPLFFVVPERYLLGTAFACAVTYSAFRLLGYLDSKGLLAMPGRKRPVFRWAFFVWPVLAVPLLWQIEAAKGFNLLVLYYASLATLGTATSLLLAFLRKEQR